MPNVFERSFNEKFKARFGVLMATASLSTVLLVVCNVAGNTRAVALKSLSLRDLTLPQFSQSEGEMKADDNIFEDEGQTPKVFHDWTGHGGAAFNYLKTEASNPVAEAEDSISDTLRRATPHRSRYDLYGSWGSSRSRHENDRFSNNLKRMREAEEARRRNEDSSFFSGVQKAFGKKEGHFLMKEFDPTLKAAPKKHHNPDAVEPRHFKHPGVIASATKIKALVSSLRNAHGKKKDAVKAKMAALQSEIANDYAKVTAFGRSARTQLKKEEAKKAAAAAAH
mmetsp:Transcript_26528/g.54035  ORF Transcript_26528/g.54035 Transcript_26528/m.54035 type:complete len:281 (+) Transcript_26528:54-896(+)